MKLLDLYCCEGGAARGYQNAGFEVYGVDMLPKFEKRYAGDHFTTMSALTAITKLLDGEKIAFTDGTTLALEEIDAIHASPPCQAYSITKHGHNKQHPMLIEATRELLKLTGKPYVIENVAGAPLIDPLTLCWSMFNDAGSVIDTDGTPLRMERHRLFETNFHVEAPRQCSHPRTVQVAGSYGGARRDKVEARTIRKGGYVPAAEIQQQLLGIDWMTQYGMYQSLPPVYTEHLGRALIESIQGNKPIN